MIAFVIVRTAFAEPTWKDIQGGGWTPVSTRDHAEAGKVEVLQRTIAGIECYQGTALVDLPMSVLLDVVTDVPGSVKWSTAGIAESKILAKNGNQIDYYQLLDVPGWTLSADRFWFLRGTLEQASDRAVFRWERLVDGGPYGAEFASMKERHADAIEPPVNVGAWALEAEGTGARIRYYVCSDTGGAIPASVQSIATKKTLPDTVGDVVREARVRKGG